MDKVTYTYRVANNYHILEFWYFLRFHYVVFYGSTSSLPLLFTPYVRYFSIDIIIHQSLNQVLDCLILSILLNGYSQGLINNIQYKFSLNNLLNKVDNIHKSEALKR